MLSGIKTGKKKKRKTDADPHNTISEEPAKKPHSETSHNVSAAQQLKQQLASGIMPKSDSYGLEARLSQATTTASASNKETNEEVVVLTGAAAATVSNRPDYQPGM